MTSLDICKRIAEIGGHPYYVGGSVRDKLLGFDPKDIDIVVEGLNKEKLLEAFPQSKLVGKDFPVIIVDGHEVALTRREKKIGKGHDGFECTTKDIPLRDDLERRDLTINAIAENPFTGQIIDPFNGQKDIKDRLLQPVGDHFLEDPLRVLRAARFSCLGFESSFELKNICSSGARSLHEISPERIWAEILKVLQSNNPRQFFESLWDYEALHRVLPEISNLKNRPQPQKWHPEICSYEHTLQVITRAKELGGDSETMFAALVHDLGKAITDNKKLPSHYGHESLGVPLVVELCDRLRIPNSFRKIAILTCRDHLNVHRCQEMRPVKIVRLLMRLNVIHDTETLSKVTLACQADAQGRGQVNWNKPYPQRDYLRRAAQAIQSVDGKDFAGMDPKKIKQRLEQKRIRAVSNV
jgi:tRNA nucleotidyltransferase (CCA-adding enzyme)